jgi:RNA polymerase sigma-70 factor (ECF subfamily)
MHSQKGNSSSSATNDETNVPENVISASDFRQARRALADPKEAELLLVRLAPRVRQTVRLQVGRDQDAEEITQACLVAILENLGGYKGAGPLEAWAGRLTYRVMMRHLSRRRRCQQTETPTPWEVGSTTSTPEESARLARLRDVLERHLAKLPQERRTTIVYRLVYQFSVPEVAQMMNVPINTVRDRIRVALKELRASVGRDSEITGFLNGKKP